MKTSVILKPSNLKRFLLEIKNLLDPGTQKMTISWSGVGPLKKGGYSRFTIEKDNRPVFFLEKCRNDVGKMYLQIFCITSTQNEFWDESFKKNQSYFLYDDARYFSTVPGSKQDRIHFEAIENRYLRFKIWQRDQSTVSLAKLKIVFDSFLKNVENTGDQYYFECLVKDFSKFFAVK